MEENKKSTKISEKYSRRQFLSTAAIAAATVTIVPRHVLGGPGYKAPSDKLNIACIGVGGKGKTDILGVSSENIVALCDVDSRKYNDLKEKIQKDLPETEISGAMEWFDKAKRYKDFRKMLSENEKDIDAVTVTTPDHTHAVAAMMALKMGKHVFVQKPLTHTIHEARALAAEAKKQGVATQMGNQGHASEGARLINEWIADGAIGDVTEVHCWTNRPIWPQGIPAPTETETVPPELDWDLWLGPAAYRPYHSSLGHFVWRGWQDFGTGAVGDMGAHILDHPYWALNLKYPETIQATSTRMNDDSYPLASRVKYKFPARGKMPALDLYWHDGGLEPFMPEDLEPGRRMGDWNGGMLFKGTKGKLMSSCYGSSPRIFPEEKMRAYARPAKTIERSPGIYKEWIEAAKAGKKSTTDFSYSGPLTETMLLGVVATKMQDSNTILEWDGKTGQITNIPEANELLHMQYREGWTL